MKRGAAVRTARADEAESAVLVAEQHQVFPKQLAPHRFAFELCGEADRLPIAAHHRAARCTWANAGEIGVFLGRECHFSVSYISREGEAYAFFEYGFSFRVLCLLCGRFPNPIRAGRDRPLLWIYVLSVVKSHFLVVYSLAVPNYLANSFSFSAGKRM